MTKTALGSSISNLGVRTLHYLPVSHSRFGVRASMPNRGSTFLKK